MIKARQPRQSIPRFQSGLAEIDAEIAGAKKMTSPAT
jgi:hypothetical protein